MFAMLEGPDLLVVLLIILVLFGGAKVPQLARSLGQAKREFEQGASHGNGSATPADDESPPPSDHT
jgi:sec-independent protein translocase protein TatA